MTLKAKALYKVKDATMGKVVGYKVADKSDHEMAVKLFGDTNVEKFSTENKVVLNAIKG